jgi:hypothetical protein
VAIIGVNRIAERPMVRGGEVVVRKMMNLSSSFDHRTVDAGRQPPSFSVSRATSNSRPHCSSTGHEPRHAPAHRSHVAATMPEDAAARIDAAFQNAKILPKVAGEGIR